MSCPASSSAARLGTAKSGVPMKARRSLIAVPAKGSAGSGGRRCREALRLGELAQNDVALQRRDTVDEEDALEMIHLVLDDGGEQTLGRHLADLVLVIEIAHPDPGGSGHVGVVLGQRQASFVVGRQL